MRRRIFVALALATSGCTAAASAAVTVDYEGNYTDTVTLPPDAVTLEPSSTAGARTWALKLSAPAPMAGGTLNVDIALGATPATGTYAPASVGDWSAVMVASTNCAYSAGNTAVPFGDFTLTLDEVPTGDTAGPAHGTLTLSQIVHAPPGVDCGPDDEETVYVAF